MKIKLLTFSKASNYGAIMQCYALCEVLKKLGHDVELIDLPLISGESKSSGRVYTLLKSFLNFKIVKRK